MKCKDCIYLRHDVGPLNSKAPVPKMINELCWPCNRYPQNILRCEDEPACGEFEKLDSLFDN